MDHLSAYGVALIPVVIALAELLKRMGVPNTFIPAVSIVIGLVLSYFYLAPDDPHKAILLGIVLGLSSIGLFSGGRSTIRGIRNRKI